MDFGSLISSIVELIKLISGKITDKPKLNFELGRKGITNYFYDKDGKSGKSSVEILFELSNSGTKPIGISKILVNSKDKDYFIATITYESKWGKMGKSIRSFILVHSPPISLINF